MISNNEFLQSVLESEAWKMVSEHEVLSMEVLEKYQDKLDWEELSENTNILWTIEGVKKFSHRINWSEFSSRCPDSFICEATLREFHNKWDWKKLSHREEIYNNWELLDKFADDMVWTEVIDNWDIKNPIEFLSKYQSRIPLGKLQESRLWTELVDKRANELYQEAICSK